VRGKARKTKSELVFAKSVSVDISMDLGMGIEPAQARDSTSKSLFFC